MVLFRIDDLYPESIILSRITSVTEEQNEEGGWKREEKGGRKEEGGRRAALSPACDFEMGLGSERFGPT